MLNIACKYLKLLFLGLCVFCCGQVYAQHERGALVLQSAELMICGKTNVNEFSCRLIKSDLNDTLATFDKTRSGTALLEGLEVAFRVNDFGCDQSMMTRDFRQLLRSDEYPHIVLWVTDVSVRSGLNKGASQEVTACVGMRITDVEREDNIDRATVELQEKCMVFSGNHQVLMTSFNIEPPTKFFGAVKAADLLEVQFIFQVL